MKSLIASLLGALVLFIWGFISWAALPFHTSTMRGLSNEDTVIAALRSGNASTGVYQMPSMNGPNKEAAEAKWKAGPMAMVFYSAEGMNNMAMYFIKGFIVYVIAVWIAVMMLSKISWSLASYGNRVRFMAMIGLILAVGGRLNDWAFMHFPTDFSLLLAADDVIGWTLAGLVVARIIKPAIMKAA